MCLNTSALYAGKAFGVTKLLSVVGKFTSMFEFYVFHMGILLIQNEILTANV